MDTTVGVTTPTGGTSSPGTSSYRWLARKGQRFKGANREGSKDNRHLYIVITFLALISGASIFYLPKVSPREMFGTRPWKASDDFDNDTFDNRCFFSVGTFDNRCNDRDPSQRGLQMKTFQPRQWSLAPRLGEDQEKQVEDSPSFGRCRPLCRVADSGPKAKVNYPFISALPSLKLYPRMCGLNSEPDSRPGLSPVNPSSTPGALTSRGRPPKGPADGYLLPEPQERPHPGSAEGPKQPMLQQRPLLPREQPQQVGLAEGLPRRVRNLLGPRSSAAFTAASGELQPSA